MAQLAQLSTKNRKMLNRVINELRDSKPGTPGNTYALTQAYLLTQGLITAQCLAIEAVGGSPYKFLSVMTKDALWAHKNLKEKSND